ncbi:MAG: IS481 family transposase [Bacteroidota bacterium]|nr:IS481 family transposase [Bacteroidota bacterium]
MHDNTKLLPYQRREIFRRWQQGDTIVSLAEKYMVSRQTIYKVLKQAKLGMFENLSSINYRYRSLYYGLRKLSKIEKQIAKKLTKRERRLNRYEKDYPGEMVHFDTKKLPLIPGEGQNQPREHLHVAIDDYSRWVFADIMPDKTSYSAAIHLEETLLIMPFQIEKVYSDNGSEYKGREKHAFVALCQKQGLKQGFTKPRHPQTNGKAERMIKTLMTEWHKGRYFSSREQRRRQLYAYVNWYNQVRSHQSLNGYSPLERLEHYFDQFKLNMSRKV